MFVLEAEGPNLYQLRRVYLWTKGSALRPLGTRNSSCRLCVPSITLKDCPVILSGKRVLAVPSLSLGNKGGWVRVSERPNTLSPRV